MILVALGFGVLLTGVTTSFAFSQGVIVPLYHHGYVKHREVIPYVLGANIGTLFDTVIVAVVRESPEGVTLVVALLVVVGVVTMGALLWFSTYPSIVETVQTRLIEDRRYLVVFLVSLVVVPLTITLLPF